MSLPTEGKRYFYLADASGISPINNTSLKKSQSPLPNSPCQPTTKMWKRGWDTLVNILKHLSLHVFISTRQKEHEGETKEITHLCHLPFYREGTTDGVG